MATKPRKPKIKPLDAADAWLAQNEPVKTDDQAPDIDVVLWVIEAMEVCVGSDLSTLELPPELRDKASPEAFRSIVAGVAAMGEITGATDAAPLSVKGRKVPFGQADEPEFVKPADATYDDRGDGNFARSALKLSDEISFADDAVGGDETYAPLDEPTRGAGGWAGRKGFDID